MRDGRFREARRACQPFAAPYDRHDHAPVGRGCPGNYGLAVRSQQFAGQGVGVGKAGIWRRCSSREDASRAEPERGGAPHRSRAEPQYKASLNVACGAGFHGLRTGRRKPRHIGIIRYALLWMCRVIPKALLADS
jgi:hypothetical protein